MDDFETLLDIPPDAAAEAAADAAAEAEIDAGHGIPHERMREWLKALAKGEKLPLPDA